MRRWELVLKKDMSRYRAAGKLFFATGLVILTLVFTACASTPEDDPEAAPRVPQPEERQAIEPDQPAPDDAIDSTGQAAELEMNDRVGISPFREVPPSSAPEIAQIDTPTIELLEITPAREPEITSPALVLPSTDALLSSQNLSDAGPPNEQSEAVTQDTGQDSDSVADTIAQAMSMLEQAAPSAPDSTRPDVDALSGTVQPQDGNQPPVATQPPGSAPEQTAPQETEPVPIPPTASDVPSGREEDPVDTRELAAAVGEEVSVELPGLGWIYLGSDDPEAPELQMRTHHAETTEFVFRTRGEGTHRLRFQRQDLALGSQETQELLLNTLPMEDLVRLRQDATDDEAAAETALGGDAGVDSPGDDTGVDSSEDGQLETSSTDMSPEDLHAALELSLLEGHDNEAEEMLQRLLDAGYVPEATLLREAAVRRADRGEIGGAIDLLEQYLVEYPSRTGRDRVHYLLGSLYEADSERRDLRESRTHYGVVVNEFPRSQYLDESQRRINYQNRHFFEIR